MEVQLEEESMSRMHVIILGITLVVVVIILLDVIFGGNTGFIRKITCGIVSFLPGGSLVSIALECGAIPV